MLKSQNHVEVVCDDDDDNGDDEQRREPGDTVADGDEHGVPHAVVVEPDHHRVKGQKLVNHLGKPSHKKSAVFFNIVQKAPPPFRLNIMW